jgi:hypothetical protein
MVNPSTTLELLAIKALRAEIAAKKAVADFEEAKLNFVEQAEKEQMLNPDTKAVGPVKLSITENRYFDLDTAITLVPEEVVEESKVTVVDTALLKQHMTPIQVQAAMKYHPKKYKVGFKVNK